MTAPRLVTPSTFAPDAPANGDLPLVPQPSPGRDAVAFDLPGVLVGTAEYAEGPTGCTVVHIPAGARTAVDARGGAVGMSGGYEFNHAICLAGGSVYGLAAAAGVSAELLARAAQPHELGRAAARVRRGRVRLLPARQRDPSRRRARPRRAAERAGGAVPGGAVRRGRAAPRWGRWSSPEPSSPGRAPPSDAFGEIKILVVTVVNAIGVVVDRDGTIVRGNYRADEGTRCHPHLDYADGVAAAVHGNTTLSVLVTNARLTDRELGQLGRQVHSSMHRGIQPFHTENDGDVLFALTTDEVDLNGLKPTGLGAIASEVAWDAILCGAL